MAALQYDLNAISIHALRVESDGQQIRLYVAAGQISIHALRVESDQRSKGSVLHRAISIHALRVESDLLVAPTLCSCQNFNPRSPCGERLVKGKRSDYNSNFNPRSPCGERPKIFLTSPLIRSDFNPRSPCGERLFERYG